MAILVIQYDGRRRAARLPRRLLIGRRSMNHVVIDHRAVSRIHAWISGEGYSYTISDTGSRSGTRVNADRVAAPGYPLSDGDQITVGPATFTFLAGNVVPQGVEEVDLSAEPVVAAEDKGVRFDCLCGAPLFAGTEHAGRHAQCRYCGQDLVIPHASMVARRDSAAVTQEDATATSPTEVLVERREVSAAASRLDTPALTRIEPPAAAAPGPAVAPAGRNGRAHVSCGVCQSATTPFEETTKCPACGLTFHAECWAENYGCSSYGCSQVNVLQPPPSDVPVAAAVTADGIGGADPEKADRPPAFPWEFLLLAGSVFSTLVGAVTFGVPALAVAGGAATYLARGGGGGRRTGIVLLSTALSLVGVVTGVAVSYVLYFGGAVSR